VTGIIHHVEKEPDDDEHIQLQLHLQFEDLLNDRNRTGRQGCLVLEPICQNPLRDPYTVKTLDSSRAPWVCHPGWIPSRGYHNFPYVGIDNRQGIGSGNRVGITERGDSSLGLDFTKVRGAHTVDLGSMGIRLGYLTNAVYASTNFGPIFNFTLTMTAEPDPTAPTSKTGFGFASFLFGTGSGGAFELAAQPAMMKHFYGWYVRDDWKGTRKLTLNLGLRCDMQTAALEGPTPMISAQCC